VVFDFIQGGSVVVLIDEGLDEIEDLFLSLCEHRISFDLLSIIISLAGRVKKKIGGA
jgi:hypothetical protein